MKKPTLGGPGYLIQGLKLLPHPRLRWFVIGPMIINLLLFIGLTVLIFDQFNALLDWLTSYLPQWLEFLEWFLWVLVVAMMLIVYGYSYALVGNLLASPFYGLLAERATEIISGRKNDAPMSTQTIMKIAGRSFARELKKLLYFIPRIAGVFLLSLAFNFLPPLNILSSVIVFSWGAWSLALQYLDYPADNDEVSFPTLRQLTVKKRMSAFSFGGTTLLATTAPVVNMIAIPASVVAATLLWEREVRPTAVQQD